MLILADDLGYGDLRCYNDQSKVATPCLDRLESEGIRMTDAHSPATVCTPTRYGLLTGQMPFRISRGGVVFSGVGGPSLIAPDRLTLASMLQRQGYATACVGKWHVGMTFFDEHGQAIPDHGVESVNQIDYSRAIQGGPIEYGFDYFFGTACCPTTDWLYAFIHQDRIPTPPTQLIDKLKLPKHPYAHDCRPGMIADDFPMEEVDLVFLEKSRKFLQQHVQQNPQQPFFLFHSTQAVHLPSFPARQFQGKTNAGPHGDFIHQLDWIVGELLETLEQLDVYENTLVIFTSDNGPETTSVIHMRQDHDHDPARPWRGMKRDNWEGGHRIPFIVRWPARLDSGTTCDQLTCLTDIVATVAGVIDLELPDESAEDSFNMLPAWTGEFDQAIRPYLIHQAFRGSQTLAIRRQQWKWIDHPDSGGNRYEANPGLKPLIIAESNPAAAGQLYDLSTDPGEMNNLVETRPEIARELKRMLEESKSNGRSRPIAVKR
ncbi:MAG: sulfatase-like hydrolase/transferase [Pirellulaceae bacterium]|nr:sulfatase-like hydrolase/transferase [Pirellulaceae bacterium]